MNFLSPKGGARGRSLSWARRLRWLWHGTGPASRTFSPKARIWQSCATSTAFGIKPEAGLGLTLLI